MRWLKALRPFLPSCDTCPVGLPRVFLLPCIFGDEPPFADFRAALSDRVAFELIDYPGIDRPSSEIRGPRSNPSRTFRRTSAGAPTATESVQ